MTFEKVSAELNHLPSVSSKINVVCHQRLITKRMTMWGIDFSLPASTQLDCLASPHSDTQRLPDHFSPHGVNLLTEKRTRREGASSTMLSYFISPR